MGSGHAGCGFVIGRDVQDLSILDCAAVDLGGDGIAVRSSESVRNIMINNTLVSGTARIILGQPAGIRVKGEANITVSHNTVRQNPYAGIMVGWQTGDPPPRGLGAGLRDEHCRIFEV